MTNEPLYWRVWVIATERLIVIDDNQEAPPLKANQEAHVSTFSDWSAAQRLADEWAKEQHYEIRINTIPF